MNFKIEIDGDGRQNIASVTVTTIGRKTALEVNFLHDPPTPKEVEATICAIDVFMKANFGPSAALNNIVKTDDVEHVRKLVRQHLGGGQG